MKKKLSIGFAVALALVLMSVTAMAAAGLWGVIDFANLYGTKLLDSAADTVQTDIPQQGGQTTWANFTLRELVCDGQAAYMVFDVTPADEHTLLVFADVTPDSEAQMLSNDYPADMTVAEWAASKGYTNIVQVSIGNTDAFFVDLGIDERMTESGMTLHARGQYQGSAEAQAEFQCVAVRCDEEYTVDRTTLTATIHVDEPLWTATSTEPVEYPEAGVRIDSVTLTGTVMSVYTEIGFTVTDQAIYDSYEGGFWFELIDENGDRLPSGAMGTGGMSDPDAEGHGLQHEDLQAMNEAPSEVIIRAYSAWTKERCEPVTVPLNK